MPFFVRAILLASSIGALAAVAALVVRRSLVETTSAEVRAHRDAGTMRRLMTHPRPPLSPPTF